MVYLDDAPRRFPNRWHALVSVCRSLDHDGLHYRAELDLERRSVTIFAHGTPKTRKLRPPALNPVAPPRPLTREQCGKNVEKAKKEREWALRSIRERMRNNWQVCPWRMNWRRDTEYYWTPTRREARAKVGRLVARIIAARRKRGLSAWHVPDAREYAQFDQGMGFRVTRASELRTHERDEPYMAWFVERYADGKVRERARTSDPQPEREAVIFEQCALAKADVEFWRELEFLSGQRQHFKPRRDETADDEVAA